MKKSLISLVLAGSIVCYLPSVVLAETIKGGTAIRLKLLNAISSKDASEGQGVSFIVIDNVIDPQTQKILIRSGTPASGTISKVENNGIAGKKGELGLTINQTEAVDGTFVPLSATLDNDGRGKRGTAIGLTVVGALIFLPLMLFIFKKGKEAKIPVGSEIIAYVTSDIAVYPEKDTNTAITTVETSSQSSQSYTQELEQLDGLVKKGIITPEEFETKKHKLLGL